MKKILSKSLDIKLYRLVLLLFSYCFIAFLIGVLISRSSMFLRLEQDVKKLETYSSKPFIEDLTTWIDDEDKVHDGLILVGPFHYNKSSIKHPALTLVDKNGSIAHKWYFKDRKILDEEVGIRMEHFNLFPNGDVIILSTSPDAERFDSEGYEIIRINKDSEIIWRTQERFHHWFDVAKDGNIYALTKEKKLIKSIFPSIDYSDNGKAYYSEHFIKVISPAGKIVNTISISEAFKNSNYRSYLHLALNQRDRVNIFDIFHTNTVQYLDANLAKSLPFTKKGDLLLSLRQMSLIAILRPSENKIIWARRGPWKFQHSTLLSSNGKILLFDNAGGTIVKNLSEDKIKKEVRSRVLEYDPISEITRVIFHDTGNRTMYSKWLSGFQKLANNNFIIFSSEASRIIQIDENKNIVWELRGIKDRDKLKVHDLAKIPQATYHKRSDLKFLK